MGFGVMQEIILLQKQTLGIQHSRGFFILPVYAGFFPKILWEQGKKYVLSVAREMIFC